jgi:hypothetical protein
MSSKFAALQRLYDDGVKNALDTADKLNTYAENILLDLDHKGEVKWLERVIAATETAIPGDKYKNLAIDGSGKVSGSFAIPIADGVDVALPVSMNRSDQGPKAAHGWIATVGDSEPFEITSDVKRKGFLDAAHVAIEQAIRKLTNFPKLG